MHAVFRTSLVTFLLLQNSPPPQPAPALSAAVTPCALVRAPLGEDRRSFAALHTRLRGPFGAYRASFKKGHKHAGIDLAGDPRTPVFAICEGRVIDIHLGFPHRTVVVLHALASGGTFFSSYKHVEDIRVSIGDTVDATTTLARLFDDDEKRRAGFPMVHLHFEIRRSVMDGGAASWTSMTMPALRSFCSDPLSFFAARLEGGDRAAAWQVIVPRRVWDESSPAGGGMTRYTGELAPTLDWIVIHHSSFVEPPGPVGIVDYHRGVYGWSDIGYHFVIDHLGEIHEARAIDLMGAHAGTTLEANRTVRAIRKGELEGDLTTGRKLDPDWGAIGIVLDGNYHFTDPSPEQLAALGWLVERLAKKYGVPPGQVISHQEVKPRIVAAAGLTLGGEVTTCPGPGLQRWLDERRAIRD